jgi:hypothetical protein
MASSVRRRERDGDASAHSRAASLKGRRTARLAPALGGGAADPTAQGLAELERGVRNEKGHPKDGPLDARLDRLGLLGEFLDPIARLVEPGATVDPWRYRAPQPRHQLPPHASKDNRRAAEFIGRVLTEQT